MPSAAILAGGQARRFGGRDKRALVVAGRTILERQLDALSRISDDILIVGGDGRGTAQARGVPDRTPHAGPLGGLDAALAAARHDCLALVACDMPFVSGALLEYLLSLSGEADAVVPQTEHGYHPLCAVYARSCHAAVERQLALGRHRMVDLLDTLSVRVVSGAEIERFGDRHRLLANVNTPADFSRHEL